MAREDPEARKRAIEAICLELVGKAPDRIDFPGGRSRKSALAHFAGSSFVVSRRRSSGRASLEATVLAELSRLGAPVPRLVASKDKWVVQEYLAGPRLSQSLDSADSPGRAVLLNAAIDGLRRVQEAGRRAGFAGRTAQIGIRRGWLQTLAETPRRLGVLAGLQSPDLDEAALVALLAPKRPAFIKWDARPGNAILTAGGSVAWFDFEHSGCRSPLDDLAWLLGDEWSPDDAGIEAGILDTHLADFAGGRDRAEAHEYLMAFGTLHMCVRLSLILSRKGEGGWWDRERCLAGDKIGVTVREAEKTCRRAARWSEAGPLTRPLSGWFGQMCSQVGML